MTVSKVKKKKLINEKKFLRLAKRVNESFEEEAKYLQEKRLRNGNNLSSDTYPVS